MGLDNSISQGNGRRDICGLRTTHTTINSLLDMFIIPYIIHTEFKFSI